MDFEQVYQRFLTLTGLNEESATKWRWLCSDAMCQLAQRVNSTGEQIENCGRLSAAAGSFAYYLYSLLQTDSAVKSFKAGDVTIGLNGSESIAKEIWRVSESAIADLLIDEDFIFKRVKS